MGRTYSGLEKVDHLVTLGSPHDNLGGRTRGGHMSQRIKKRYPGAFFSSEVNYVTVAGRLHKGNKNGSLRERWAHKRYKEIVGDGDVWGDGLVPTKSALLDGAFQIVLDGVGHFSGFGGPWYGHEDIIPGWWGMWQTHHQETAAFEEEG